MRVRLTAAKRARIAGVAQIAPAKVDAAAEFEREAGGDRATLDGDWVGDGQEWHKGDEGEGLGELHID
jgi:hypothetical protein